MTVVLMVIRMPYSRIAERDNEQWQLNLYPLTIIERDPGFSDQLFIHWYDSLSAAIALQSWQCHQRRREK